MFGMGTGGTPPQEPPESRIPRQGQEGQTTSATRVLVLLEILGQASRPISTGQLRPLPDFHILPINLVVSEGSSG